MDRSTPPPSTPRTPPRLENTKTSDRQIRFLIYHLEIASKMADKSGGAEAGVCFMMQPGGERRAGLTLPFHSCVIGAPALLHPHNTIQTTPRPFRTCAGVGKMCWLLDFQGYTFSNAPPLKVSLLVNSILQNHYPERLGCAVCYHAPTLFSMTWKVGGCCATVMRAGQTHSPVLQSSSGGPDSPPVLVCGGGMDL